MEASLKKSKIDKKKTNLHPLFMSKDMILYIFGFLPAISIMAMLRAFPHIRKRGWMTSAKVIDMVYKKLQKSVPGAFFDTKYVYTGSKVIEVMLGEKFTNGKLDTDILSYNEWERRQRYPYFEYYYHKETECRILYNESPAFCLDILVCSKGYKDRVELFDFDVCKLFVSPEKLYIAFPLDLLKKKTKLYIDEQLTQEYKTAIDIERIRSKDFLHKIQKQREYRLKKYTNRGFAIEIVHTIKSKKGFCEHYNSDKLGDIWDKWQSIRLPEGVWKNEQ
jgi:hypothetical protein